MTPEAGAPIESAASHRPPHLRATLRRPIAAMLAAGLLIAGALGMSSTSAGAAPDGPATDKTAISAAQFLASSLTDGNHYMTTSTYNGTTSTFADQGLTADGVFALLAAGGHESSVTAMTTWLGTQAGAYTDAASNFAGGPYAGPYSGSVAKLALVAIATGTDPRTFGGLDLIDLLTSHPCTAAAADGTCTAAGDFFNAYSSISQSLGILALQAQSDASLRLTAQSPQVQRLHALQCSDGGFDSQLTNTTCTSTVDATGYAIAALAAVEGTQPWLAAAQRYLKSAQQSSGLFGGESGDNSNSTALAAQALATIGTGDPNGEWRASGGQWQRALSGLLTLQTEQGGFRISATHTDADVRATTQSVIALSQKSLPSLADIATPSLTRAGGESAADSDDESSTTWWWAAAILLVIGVLAALGLAVRRRRT